MHTFCIEKKRLLLLLSTENEVRQVVIVSKTNTKMHVQSIQFSKIYMV